MQRAARILFLVAGVCVAAFLGSAGCGVGSPPTDRILFVGIDSADWNVIDPLIEQGKLPNLSALVKSGVSCDLHSLEPKQKSPTIWATIATGKLPDKHGINPTRHRVHVALALDVPDIDALSPVDGRRVDRAKTECGAEAGGALRAA